MAKTHQLSLRERQAIDSEFKDCTLYTRLKSMVLEWGGDSVSFALSPAEAFYHLTRSMDDLLSAADKDARMEYCRNLCNELFEHLAEAVDAESADCRKAACIVVGALDACLYAVDHQLYLDEIIALKSSNDYRRELQTLFKSWMRSERNTDLREWLSAYFVSDIRISSMIEAKIRQMRQAESEAQEKAKLRQNAEVYIEGNNYGLAAKTMTLSLPDGSIKTINPELLNKLLGNGNHNQG